MNKAHRNRLWGQHLTEAVATSCHSPHLSTPICLQPITRYVSYCLRDKSMQHTEVALHTLPGYKTVLGMLFPNGSLSAINVLVLMSKLRRWWRECWHWHNASKRWFPLQLHHMHINILERYLLHLYRPFAITLINRSIIFPVLKIPGQFLFLDMMRLTCDMEWNAKKHLEVADDKWGKIMQQGTNS